MPPRLNHRKSRMGCLCCKERKIKCDEAKPICSACQRHGVKCTYSDVIPPRRKRNIANIPDDSIHSSSSTASGSPARGPDIPYETDDLDITEGQRKQIELFLLHRFINVVSSTFPAAESEVLRHVYSQDAVELSFMYPFLQNTILAIAALYTALQQTHNPAVQSARFLDLPPVFKNVDFAQVHRVFLNLAIQQQRAALVAIDAGNADALGLTSIMLSMIAARLLPDTDSATSVGRPYEPPIQSLYISEATGPILHAALPHLLPNSPIRKIMQQGETNLQKFFHGSRTANQSPVFEAEHLVPFQHLLDFEDQLDTEDKDPRVNKSYTNVLAFIGGIHSAILRGELNHQICRRIMSFAPVVPKYFVQLLAELRPRALVIFAHYMALVKRVERYWWLAGAAEREVHGIASILPERWQWAMDWPKRMILQLAVDGSASQGSDQTQLRSGAV